MKRTETIGVSRSVIRARISTTIRRRGQTSILQHNLANVSCETSIHVIGVDGNSSTGRISSHVLVHEGKNGLLGCLVVCVDCARSEKATLLAGVEVELNGVLGLEFSIGEDAKGFKDVNDTATVIVSSRTFSSC